MLFNKTNLKSTIWFTNTLEELSFIKALKANFFIMSVWKIYSVEWLNIGDAVVSTSETVLSSCATNCSIKLDNKLSILLKFTVRLIFTVGPISLAKDTVAFITSTIPQSLRYETYYYEWPLYLNCGFSYLVIRY